MRKALLLFMFAVISANVFGQKQETAVFVFSNPEGLTPSVTPSPDKGISISVNDIVFSEKSIRMSFAATSTGARICTSVTDIPYYYLQVAVGTTVTFSTVDNATIDEVDVSYTDNILGSLGIKTGQEDKVDWEKTGGEMKHWYLKDNVDNISFYNNGTPSQFHQVFVKYTTPSDILEPLTTSIDNVETLPSFNELVLTFDKTMTVLDASGIKIEGENFSASMTAEASGKKIVLSLDTPIEEDGEYTITIPVRSFESTDGYQNKELTYTFKVEAPKNTFMYDSVDPKTGSVEVLPGVITLTFPNLVGKVTEVAELTLYKDGKKLLPMVMETNAEAKETVVLKVKDDLQSEFTEEGVYTVTIPEGTIFNPFYGRTDERYNPEFTLKYLIGVEEEDPTPQEPVELKYVISPEGDVTNELIITFVDDSNALFEDNVVTLADPDKISLKLADGTSLEDAEVDVTVHENVANCFVVNIGTLEEGGYILAVDDAAFTYSADGENTADVKGFEYEFNVKVKHDENGTIFIEDAEYQAFAIWNQVPNPTTDVSLNDLVVYKLHNNGERIFYANSEQTVELMLTDVYFGGLKGEPLFTGHFVPVNDFPMENATAYKLVFDTPIKAGDLRASQYTYVIPARTFGDADFGKYLMGEQVSECHVNGETSYTVRVNNAAAAISDISKDAMAPVIYTITGNRVNSMNKAGVYIVNGKKIIIK